jgi:Amt family ammonium transporter
MQILKIAIAALGLLCLPAFGQDEVGSAATEPVFNALDTLWILLAAFLVFFMQAGFGMLEAGLVRSKNAANIIMKNLLDFCFAALGYFIFGYAIMYGAGNLLFGTSGWFLVGAESAVEGVPLEAVWLFQAVFAGTAATIVAGAVAERMRFVSYLAYSFLISAFIYPVVGHWRFGRFSADGASNVIAGHNMPLVGIGVFILWFGWFGFNAGSTLGFGDPQLVARVALNTTLAPSTAAIAAMLIAWIWFGKPDLTIALNGALAGLVGITAPCAVVGPQAALLIGAVAGVLVVLGIDWLNRLRIDDPIGAVPVHALCGIWGTIAVGLFGQAVLGSPANGLFYGGGFGQLGIQCLGVLACLSFTGIAMWVVFKVIDVTIGLRVSHETELRGLDIDEHGMESYGGFQIFITE